MQYIVPQDVEVEDKVIGPLSLRQFGYMIAGGGFGFAFYSIIHNVGLPNVIGYFFAIIPLGIGISLAFLPYNGKTLDSYVFPFITFMFSPKQLIWQKDIDLSEIEIISTDKDINIVEEPQEPQIVRKRSLSEERSRIQQLANIIDGAQLVTEAEPEPTTLFESKTQASSIDKLISETSKSVPKPEPAISSLATVAPINTFTEELPDTSGYAFSEFENRVKEARAQMESQFAGAAIIKERGIRIDERATT